MRSQSIDLTKNSPLGVLVKWLNLASQVGTQKYRYGCNLNENWVFAGIKQDT